MLIRQSPSLELVIFSFLYVYLYTRDDRHLPVCHPVPSVSLIMLTLLSLNPYVYLTYGSLRYKYSADISTSCLIFLAFMQFEKFVFVTGCAKLVLDEPELTEAYE